MKRIALTFCLGFVTLLGGCTPRESSAAPPAITREVPLTATPAPAGTVTAYGSPPSLPTADLAERKAASDTRLYLTAFDRPSISVVDPKSGHALHEIAVDGQFPGMAVAPDGQRLYVLDGPSTGRLRVFDTVTWEILHVEPVADRALLLSGNPLVLSGDGAKLLVDHYSYGTRRGWVSVFDTRAMTFLPGSPDHLSGCPLPLHLVGQPGHGRSYLTCGDVVMGLDDESLAPLWRAPVPDGKRLFGLAPHVVVLYEGGYERVAETDLWLLVCETATGGLLEEIRLSEQAEVPAATIGRGDRGYIAVDPNGSRIYLAWENRLWTLAPDSLQLTGELALPAPVDGMAFSVDGREIYLLPATAGDLPVRGHGLWAAQTETLVLARGPSDWPKELLLPFVVAAPAPENAR